jgi:hypothetical protein
MRETASAEAIQSFSAGPNPSAVIRSLPEMLLATENENLPSASLVVV